MADASPEQGAEPDGTSPVRLPPRAETQPVLQPPSQEDVAEYEEVVPHNVVPAFGRCFSDPFTSGAGFLFQGTMGRGSANFELAVLSEVQRLGEQLKRELLTLRASRSSQLFEPMRLLLMANQAAALRAVEARLTDSEAVQRLGTQVKAAFMEQELLLAVWRKESAIDDMSMQHDPGFEDGVADQTDRGLEYVWRVLMVGGILLALMHVSGTIPEASIRCALLIMSVLALQLSGVVPQYCVGLLLPVFATTLQVLPGKTIAETAHLCFGAMMNQMTALVIGSFTINAVFLRCQLEVRFIDVISRAFGNSPRTFLLVLMLGCMYVSSVTFVTLLALSTMLPVTMKHQDCPGGKAYLLGVGLSCTLGGAITPLSGTASLLVLSTLTEYGIDVDFLTWVSVAFPVMSLTCICAWGILLLAFGNPPQMETGEASSTLEDLRPGHYFFIGCSLLFIVGCAVEDSLEPWVGSSGNLGLLLTALSFGSGFLAKADFAAMPWDVLMILFGVNVMSFVLKESGLALSLSHMLIPEQVYEIWLMLELTKICAVCLLGASIVSQTVFATLAIPIIVALGAQLYSPTLTALLAMLAIHCGVLAPHASTDLILTSEMASSGEGQQGRKLLLRQDFFIVGAGVGLAGFLLTSTVGYSIGIAILGMPPQPIIVVEPTELVPSIKWMGNDTTAEEKVEILEGKLAGKVVNGTWKIAKRKGGWQPLGWGRAEAPIGEEEQALAPWASPSPAPAMAMPRLPRLMSVIHHRRGARWQRRGRRRFRHNMGET